MKLINKHIKLLVRVIMPVGSDSLAYHGSQIFNGLLSSVSKTLYSLKPIASYKTKESETSKILKVTGSDEEILNLISH
jgi:hypothetical protein